MSFSRLITRWWNKANGDVKDNSSPSHKNNQRVVKQTASYTLTQDGYQIAAGILSDVGCAREINEDCGRYFNPGDADLIARRGVLLVVADGVGGSFAGEIASQTAVDVIGRVYYEHPGDDLETALVQGFHEANREIYSAAEKNPDLTGMGTTCSALVLRGGAAISAHVGDSRLYLVRNGDIYLMTADDSVVGSLVKHGLITREEARRHPDKNVIVSALGGNPEVAVSIWKEPLPVRIDDRLVVCSDGLSDLVEDNEIKEAVLSSTPLEACKELIALAKERGGYDNITVGILGIQPTELTEPKRERITRELELAT